MARTNARAAAILLKNDKILLMHRVKDGKKYWVFPGGGVEAGEKAEKTVVREIEEEASIKTEVIKLLYTHTYSDIDHHQYYYLCKYLSGTPRLGDFNEARTMTEENQTYKPMWIKIVRLPELLLYPLEIRDWLTEDIKNNFKNTPRSVTLKIKDLRQDI